MALPDIEIDLLRAFVAVAEAGSMTGGAGIVGRTQSAVSQKILRLEELIGRRVFERSSRSLSLTADGERLLGAARRMIEFNDETMRQFVSPVVSGRLRLGVTEDFIPQQLPRLLARFARTYPDIVLELTTGMSCDLLALLDKGDLDLAIAKRDGAMQRGRIIWREPLEWIAAENFEVRAGQPVPLVLLPQPCTYRGLALEALETVGRVGTISCTASSLMGVQAAVAGGLGVTVLGRSFLQPGLRVLAIGEDWPPLPMTEIVLLGEERAKDHLARALVSFLMESLTRSTLQLAA
ncbi:transcriptional regulator [Labrys miyagiensis]